MKQEAKKKLIKDVLPFIITVAVVLVIMIIGLFSPDMGLREILVSEGILIGIVAFILAPLIMGFEVAGFILGWKWASQRWVALNLVGLIIKVCIAVFAGYIIFPVVLIKDIISLVKA